MKDYRDIIYANYRSASYGLLNPNGFNSKMAEGYQAAFSRFLPIDTKSRILDIGCGSGFLMQFLQQKGYKNVSGVDASIEQITFAKNNGLSVTHGDGFTFLENHQGYDLIFMTDIVEHLKKDELLKMLQRIQEALNPKGRVIMRTINASSLYGNTSRYIDFTHEISFTETSLRQILFAIGFVDIEITDSKIPFGWKPKRLARWFVIKIWRFFLAAIYTAEVGIDRPRLFGKFLISCATKP
ncbi:class I SAM-dependent methyltransferase [Candidatus Parabeggiatoa sp. HSG14]|uniref:class I SAM-dependent methyltransferase n=1 Tax=Candidatus Parabeggiatoa sp. HSG14 TaxID=3055593 RepID=UPI0025A74110|nr:class I SAM-dependent methyltransferase [Thiotrichales bacterium HSG14]